MRDAFCGFLSLREQRRTRFEARTAAESFAGVLCGCSQNGFFSEKRASVRVELCGESFIMNQI